MSDVYANLSSALTSPLIGAFVIAPSDDTDLAQTTRQLRITGNAGNVAVIWLSGVETVEPVNAGDLLDWRIRRVKATGTTATGLRGYY